jgi:hypothetical protein
MTAGKIACREGLIQMKLKKILLKVVDEETDKLGWYHLAYADERVYLGFLSKLGCSRIEFAEYVGKWAQNDFNISLSMTHKNDILVLKKLVQERYHKAHPYLFVPTKTDRQGWMRAWVMKKMVEEIRYYGQPKEQA